MQHVLQRLIYEYLIAKILALSWAFLGLLSLKWELLLSTDCELYVSEMSEEINRRLNYAAGLGDEALVSQLIDQATVDCKNVAGNFTRALPRIIFGRRFLIFKID